jgi:hypothetical protein
MAYLLSKPDNWQVYISDISNHCSCGEKSIRSGISELKLQGYIKRYPVYANNKIDHWETVVFEAPDIQPQLLAQNVQVGNDTLINNNYTKYKKYQRKTQTGLCKIGNRCYCNGKRISLDDYQARCVMDIAHLMPAEMGR